MTTTQILTHRGLEPSKPNFHPESSYEAFENHLNRGFGIEFDVNFTKDNKIVIAHDKNLTRVTNGTDKRLVKDVTHEELTKIGMCTFEALAAAIEKAPAKTNALHLKGIFQENHYLNVLVTYLKKYSAILTKTLIFDVKPQTAKKLLSEIPELILAPSVAHKYDIERYNECVNNTLFSVKETIKNKELFEWVWLDEWDLADKDGKKKTFYNREVFDELSGVGYKIALVTPELHASSPGLLGGEAHEDARNNDVLFARIKEILALNPDAVCTDYPDEVKSMK